MLIIAAKYWISKIDWPESPLDYGIVQICNLHNTYFRFDIQDGKAVLDTSYFADQLEKDKHQRLDPQSDIYIETQKLLSALPIPEKQKQ